PDHCIWTLGWQWPGKSQGTDYFVLHKYSVSGQKIGAFLPRSSFTADLDPASPLVGSWRLHVVNGPVGARLDRALLSGPQRKAFQWIEADLNGKELVRLNLAGDRPVLAFTQSGALYTQERDVSRFDRTTGQWQAVGGMPDGILVGAEGESLV